MRNQERYVVSLSATYAATTFALSFFRVTLDLYLSVFIVEYFVVTLLHSPLDLKTQKITNTISYVLFAVFLVIVAARILQILGVTLL
ncbi:MAG: hypothetical protein ACQCN4_01740 [Candidatus Bathyarchaeia archaeon]|jgi:hypothetical protein